METLKWMWSHWAEIGAALALIVGGARILVKLSPTPADDSVLEKIVVMLKHIGLHVDPVAPVKPIEPPAPSTAEKGGTP